MNNIFSKQTGQSTTAAL